MEKCNIFPYPIDFCLKTYYDKNIISKKFISKFLFEKKSKKQDNKQESDIKNGILPLNKT